MREPNIEKLQLLRKLAAARKRSSESVQVDISSIYEQLHSATRSRQSLEHTGNDLSQVDQRIVELEQSKAALQTKYSQLSEELTRLIELRTSCEAWLTAKGVPVPADDSQPRTWRA